MARTAAARSTAVAAEGPAAAECGNGSSSCGGACFIRTARGVRAVTHSGVLPPQEAAAPEARINASLGSTCTSGVRGTFEAASRFNSHSGGILLAASLRQEPQGTAVQPRRQPFDEWLKGRPDACASGASGAGATASSCRGRQGPQPPAAAAVRHTSALQRLRDSVRSDDERRPPFLVNFHPLMPGDEDRFESLGQVLDLRGPGIHQK
ncbi:hypothetical protein MNEG_4506 [Monoraphidium neglectum]|uniref:Uncharacterized protein n=1 Tax=Monoraphidium neglectum TaxID=145388 RepID=A0A0D2L9C4_9CHLO|nr:hypothetical protein MNEG_4506 [Monoraphidium neglectum]KIZ03449.1 hypothetical protein MNEG_4506 [Monoraphidium neglectum]|eukprot:XP_013902468.1 hypothetical protein MNEG_4506 [Monoraphidium neglectum]